MGTQPLAKINAATAAEVCSRFVLSRESRLLLKDSSGPREFLELLIAKRQYASGIDFLAHALPAREGIWWGCLCLRQAYGDNLQPADKTACRSAVQWIMQPTEQNRVAAKTPAEMAGPASAAGALAAAAFQTATPAFAWGKALANAVKLSCARGEPGDIPRTQRSFVELGIWAARGN